MWLQVSKAVLAKDIAFITAKIDGIAEVWQTIDGSLYFDPIPLNLLYVVNPEPWFTGRPIVEIVLSAPQQQIFFIEVDKSAYFFGRFCVCDNLLDPYIRLCAHRSIQKSELIEIVK